MNGVRRFDFYQTPTHIILSLYVKGYNVPGLLESVKVTFREAAINVSLPPLKDGNSGYQFEVSPLEELIVPNESSYRVLCSKIECKLAKRDPISWKSVISSDPSPPISSSPAQSEITNAQAGPSTVSPSSQIKTPDVSAAVDDGSQQLKAKARKNWDKVVDEESGEGEVEASKDDPNSGGDAALQKLFSSIYAGADPDTKRAMIKSFTESGGTTLSTDWNSIGKETTPIRPPEGMYPVKP